jgi:RNA polymerase sigma-70 factor (ECF subfamily)
MKTDGNEEERPVHNAAAPAEPPARPGDLEGTFRRHSRQVISAAYRITGNMQDAEDVLQNVFLRLMKRSAGHELDDELGPYLRRAAVNAALDVVRSRRAARARSIEEVEATLAEVGEADPARQHGSSEIREQVRSALAGESPRAAEIFALRYFEGYDNQEIARMVGTSAGTVAVILHRTRTRLRDLIDPSLGDKP